VESSQFSFCEAWDDLIGSESSQQSGEMFIATMFLMISAKSEMPGISLFADEVRRSVVSINISCLRHVFAQLEPIGRDNFSCVVNKSSCLSFVTVETISGGSSGSNRKNIEISYCRTPG